MNDEYRKQLLEQREEIDMMLLMDEYMESEGERLQQEFEAADLRGEVPDIPVDLDLKCKEIIHNSFAKQEHNRTLSRITKYIGKVAVYILLFLGAASTLVLSVDALRIPVLNFFLEQQERSSSLDFDDSAPVIHSELDQIKICVDELLPNEYQLTSELAEANGFTLLCFQSTEGHTVLVNVVPSEGRLGVDTENTTSIDMEINGYPGLFIEKDGYTAYWYNTDKDLTYSVYSDHLSIDIFWKIVYALAD